MMDGRWAWDIWMVVGDSDRNRIWFLLVSFEGKYGHER